jgi:large subunit ribosomal protein L31
MKKGIHPENYRTVVFKDMSNDFAFLSRSTANTKESIKWEDGNEYPLLKVEVSSQSHPFYTGKAQFVDTAGRIDKFRQKYGKFNKKEEVAAAPAPAVEAPVAEAPVAEAPVAEAPVADATAADAPAAE